MDPLTVVISAIALGASAGLKDTAASAIKDVYAALKGLISRKYPTVDVGPVEAKPNSAPKRGSLEEDLRDVGAGADAELLDAARQVIAAVKDHDPAVSGALGIDIERVWAAAIEIEDVETEGTAVHMRDVQLTGEMRVKGVRAGKVKPEDPSTR